MNHHVCNFLEISTRSFHVLVWEISNLIMCKTLLGHEGVFVGGFEPENGQVHLIQLADNSADILCEGLYTHQNEIWDLAACPFDSQFFSTVYASGIITEVSSLLNLSLGRWWLYKIHFFSFPALKVHLAKKGWIKGCFKSCMSNINVLGYNEF